MPLNSWVLDPGSWRPVKPYDSEDPIVPRELVPGVLKTRVPYSQMPPGCKARRVILRPGMLFTPGDTLEGNNDRADCV